MAKKKKEKAPDRILCPGRPDLERCDNKVVSARYTPVNFLPKATLEQFSRFANVYFLCVGIIMAIGYYTEAYESAISPWTTLGPLMFVISISLLVEGSADRKRHRNDAEMNNAPCVILNRSQDIEKDEKAEREDTIIDGKDVVVNINKAFYMGTARGDSGHPTGNEAYSAANVRVGFEKVRRMDIRQGHFVLVKNRDMVPADMVILASSNDGGSAYIETSSIDGETNLKLRMSPHLPKSVIKHLRDGVPLENIKEEDGPGGVETIEAATKRLTRISALGRPDGICVLYSPDYKGFVPEHEKEEPSRPFLKHVKEGAGAAAEAARRHSHEQAAAPSAEGKYVAALVTEPPNPSVHTFSGKLTLPPLGGEIYDIPLGADNVLLRGAVLRNTEWCIGLAFFTGTDTKLVQNSFDTPSKFSQLDILMNYCVVAILIIMILCISYLATAAIIANNEEFDDLYYAGINANTTDPWPFLQDLPSPNWISTTPNWLQYFFLYVTLLSNFIPLSMYVTVEFITFCMLWLVNVDLDMYEPITDTRAVARSTNVTDLGRIQYIFSDKTGTLTQNVMIFKRCSVDGMVFGAPIQRTRPGAELMGEQTSFHPLRQLLVGRLKSPTEFAGLENLGGSTRAEDEEGAGDNKLTFNAEMFLRVMSLCHTVVVEKDIDNKETIDAAQSVASSHSGITSTARRAGEMAKNLFTGRRNRANTNGSTGLRAIQSPLSSVSENVELFESNHAASANGRDRANTAGSFFPGDTQEKGPDGAPPGYAYQAESPDEGALVTAASLTYDFQVISRDSGGIRLRTTSASHLQDKRVVGGLKSKSLTLKRLAAESANELDDEEMVTVQPDDFPDPATLGTAREETWTILAVNKFDSDRKRMSILLRSPHELGSLPILFVKGADSAMLDPDVCSSGQLLQQQEDGEMPSFIQQRPSAIKDHDRNVSALSTVSEGQGSSVGDDDVDQAGWEIAQMLGIQAHLSDFASEGLRTLVLGMRVLSEGECATWLEEHKAAATSIENRSELLTQAALKIEKDLHIVGATAIEDKLQVGVPETISTLGEAGIKLWVLTGDKRETAVEIGYSTHVLTPKMHLTEVPDNGKHYVRTQMSMEFIRLVKLGKLPQYQKAVVGDSGRRTCADKRKDFFFRLGKLRRRWLRSLSRTIAWLLAILGCKGSAERRIERTKEKEVAEMHRLQYAERCRNVRSRADQMIQLWLNSEEGQKNRKARGGDTHSEDADDLSLTSEETPAVFRRGSSAKSLLSDIRSSGKLSHAELRKMSLLQLTAKQVEDTDEPIVDEDCLSLESFLADSNGELRDTFEKKKRTLLERAFAIDRDVRKGHLMKHLTKEKLESISEAHSPVSQRSLGTVGSTGAEGPRALVIEGAALKHLLGDPELEEILFSVASKCDAVIACRVSPKQKALLVNLVRQNVKPEPITLAIGDGANDVGMIQEAHVGVGISGLEGKQAVNASDFAIAQFRFLETLVLIHGRWNFFRLSTVVLFSFYKNAVMIGCLIMYTAQTVYSGTPLFDEWIIAMLNFVAAVPIIVLGLFDRCLSKDYVRKHPQVYKATRENELITFRTLFRWICLVFVHVFSLYLFTVPQQSYGGGMTSAFLGLMRNEDRAAPGEGEGGDLQSVGTVTYTCMIILLAYKVVFESRSLIHGRWPAFTCRKGVGEGWPSRLAYTWVGITYLSIGFYLFAISIYALIGRAGPNGLSQFVDVTFHVLSTRSMSWVLIVFVPIMAMVFDVCGKVFSNMYYPTQTQINLEIEAKGKMLARQQRFEETGSTRRRRSSEGV